MEDNRSKDRRKKNKVVKNDRRKGPRRLTCVCGGKVDIVSVHTGKDNFVCLRCGKKY
ncbi:MAG: hypothetical protein LLG37_08460 [Spirochaetia bacterium]|nr:hypothetical protein [Spirochaetia bacterium]